MNCSVIIVAAGSSRRMGFDKLTAPLGGVPVLRRSIDAFLAVPSVTEVIVVTTPERFAALKLEGDLTERVRRVDGGIERRYSVANGLAAVHEDAGQIAVHDGARPLVTPEAIERCLVAAVKHGAAALARRVSETLMRVGPDGFTRGVVDRSELWVMETPQVFRARILRRAYEVVMERGEPVTDEVSAVALLGISSYLIESVSPNPKLTLPGDVQYAASLLP